MKLPIIKNIEEKYHIEIEQPKLKLINDSFVFNDINYLIKSILVKDISLNELKQIIEVNLLNNIKIIKNIDNEYYDTVLFNNQDYYIIVQDIKGYQSINYNINYNYDIEILLKNIGYYLSNLHQSLSKLSNNNITNQIIDLVKYEDILPEKYTSLIKESIDIKNNITNLNKDNYGVILNNLSFDKCLFNKQDISIECILDFNKGFYLENLIDLYYDLEDILINHNIDTNVEIVFNNIVNNYKVNNSYFDYSEEHLSLFKKYVLIKKMNECIIAGFKDYDEISLGYFEFYYEAYKSLK